MPKISVTIEWDKPDEPFWLNPDNVSLALHAYCENTHFIVRDAVDQLSLLGKISDELSASEALYGFMGWLTTRDKTVKFSASNDASPAVELITEFCSVNHLAEPRLDWEKHLVRPNY